MKLFILASVATLSCVAVACGSSSNKSSPTTPDGGEGGTSSGGEAGAGDSGSSSGGPTPYVGEVTATKAGTTTTVYTLSATFAANPDAGATTPSCAGTQSGSCCFLPATDGGTATDGGSSSITLLSAGAITFTDNGTAIANISPQTNNAYGIASTNNPSVKWSSGDTLKVSAAGATISAFTGNLATAADFAGLSPTLSYTTATTVTASAGMTISWTPGTGTTVGVLVDAKGGAITCSVDDSAGTVTVPAQLLQNYASGTEGIVSVTRTNLVKSTESNATVSFVSTNTTGGTVKFE